MVAYQLAERASRAGSPYDMLVRTGGENAEHRFLDMDGRAWRFHILPCAVADAETRAHAMCFLPNGMTFSIGGLRREMEHFDNIPGGPPSVFVGPNAAIILPEYVEEGMAAANERGSTFLGVGATMARKVRRHGFKVAKDYEEELINIGVEAITANSFLPDIYEREKSFDGCPGKPPCNVLLEASQGAMLSLDHGQYPFCTSRNVTAPAAVADAGLRWDAIRDVWMVVKVIPSRVPGPSGPSSGKELTWEEACNRAGRPQEAIRQTEMDKGVGTGGMLERPFEFSWFELEYAVALNAPTKMAVTFIDWLNYEDLGVTTRSLLSLYSREFIRRVERKTGVRVGLIRTGPRAQDCIWEGE